MIDIIITLILLGVGLYLLQMLPMDDTIRQLIRVLVIVVALLWVLTFFGGYHHGFSGYWHHP